MISQFCVDMYYVHRILNNTNNWHSHILHNSKWLSTQVAFFFGVHVSVSDRCGKCHYCKNLFIWTCLYFVKGESNFCCPVTRSKCSQLRMEKQHSSQNRRNSRTVLLGKWMPVTIKDPHSLLRHSIFAVLLKALGDFHQFTWNLDYQRSFQVLIPDRLYAIKKYS